MELVVLRILQSGDTEGFEGLGSPVIVFTDNQ